jgi:recombination protein RecA
MALPSLSFQGVSVLDALDSRTSLAGPSSVLPLGWAALDDVLPDRGLPRGVIEISAPRVLGIGTGSTTLALAAVGATHRASDVYCAWLDPTSTLFASGVAAAGVDLHRLLVVRPEIAHLATVALTLSRSGALALVVIDMHHAPKDERVIPRFVRQLAIASEKTGTRVLLLSDSKAPRSLPWPVTMRLSIERTRAGLIVSVTKDARGRMGLQKTICMDTRPLGRTG